jgi:hypothetical protein
LKGTLVKRVVLLVSISQVFAVTWPFFKSGEVRLRKGGESGNEDCDFKNWGCEIRVSFREGVKAQVLSAQVQ